MKKLLLFVPVQLVTTLSATTQTASDNYLDITQYKTIDQAGWSNDNIDNLYVFNTNAQSFEYAWLSLSVYGLSVNTSTQKWVTTTSSPYAAVDAWNGLGTEAVGYWLQGSSAYFTNKVDTDIIQKTLFLIQQCELSHST